jgi:hypothetical protein
MALSGTKLQSLQGLTVAQLLRELNAVLYFAGNDPLSKGRNGIASGEIIIIEGHIVLV